jgi:hypothetical protein
MTVGQLDDIAVRAFVQIEDPEDQPAPVWVRQTITTEHNYADQSEERMTYDRACTLATTNQGLDPVVAALTSAGIAHEVEQTGGFTTVPTVKVPAGVCAVTRNDDQDDDETLYLLGFYPGDEWYDNAENGVHTVLTLDALIAQIQRYQSEH